MLSRQEFFAQLRPAEQEQTQLVIDRWSREPAEKNCFPNHKSKQDLLADWLLRHACQRQIKVKKRRSLAKVGQVELEALFNCRSSKLSPYFKWCTLPGCGKMIHDPRRGSGCDCAFCHTKGCGKTPDQMQEDIVIRV